jgi:hypothetical protein
MQLRSGKITSKSSSSVFCKKNVNTENKLCATKTEYVETFKQMIDFCAQTKSLSSERLIWLTKINDFKARHAQYYNTCDQMLTCEQMLTCDQMQRIVDMCVKKEKELVFTLCFNNLDYTHVLNYYDSLVRLRKCMEQNIKHTKAI